MITAIVGAGGKTSLIKKYVKEYRDLGKRVFVTTSTHMMIEEDTVLGDDPEPILQKLRETGYVMAGIREGEKIRELSKETYLTVCQEADVVLIEADGAARKSIKYPNETEPVIYENVEEIVIVCGLHAIGKKLKDAAFRLPLVEKCLHADGDTVIRPEHIQTLVQEGYVKPLQLAYPEKKIRIEPATDGSLYQRALAGLMKEGLSVSILREEWFDTKPVLVICGGGHISGELVKMASGLNFYIKVLDDREEFADPARFPEADEVICDSFENLERYLEPEAYYCVVIRGHNHDYDCVRRILQYPYRYLGMIGSRLKVKATFERLLSDGFSEAQVDTIFAPIGLAIGAVTPAEISVSILAQIIEVKNERRHSFVSEELLQVKGPGTLCIIIDKKGSAPRGIGSMMFVGKDQVIDTVGGGAVEHAVMETAKNLTQPLIRDYHLSEEYSENTGMICGGSNQVLFIPLK